jgi:hypothetical protein
MKKTKSRQLKLKAECIRQLSSQVLERARGGDGDGDVQGSLDCTATYPGCHI